MVPLWLILHSAQCDDTDAQDAAHLLKPGKTPPYNIVFERARGRLTATILLPPGLPAAHCPGYNATSIGAAWFADLRKRAPSPAELAFAAAVLRPWCERWAIQPGHVVPHRTLRPGKTDCPGRYYDHAAVLAAIFDP